MPRNSPIQGDAAPMRSAQSRPPSAKAFALTDRRATVAATLPKVRDTKAGKCCLGTQTGALSEPLRGSELCALPLQITDVH
jgi:hypothetical protein